MGGAFYAGIRKGGIRGINWACLELYMGIFEGFYRKSLANGIMLQAIGPCKTMLKKLSPGWLGKEVSASKTALGFIAGSLTGAFSEVMTNHPDQVKAMTQIGVPLMEALITATKHPFRGAFYAGIRKGGIRGINWACLELYMGIFEGFYRKYRKMAAYRSSGARISELTRQSTPM